MTIYGYDQGDGYQLLRSSCDTGGLICLLLTGFDDCILGFANTDDDDYLRAVYSVSQIMDNLCEDMPREDAWEHLHFNIIGSIQFQESNSPVLVYDDIYKIQKPIAKSRIEPSNN